MKRVMCEVVIQCALPLGGCREYNTVDPSLFSQAFDETGTLLALLNEVKRIRPQSSNGRVVWSAIINGPSVEQGFLGVDPKIYQVSVKISKLI